MTYSYRHAVAAAIAGLLVAAPAACAAPASQHHHGHDMAGMDHHAMSAGTGLTSELNGYRLDGELAAAAEYRFRISGPDGRVVTAFVPEQTKQLHFYAIRSDLTGFQHLHPSLAPDGSWTAPLTPLEPGDWRLYTSFTPGSGPGKGSALVLSRAVTVPGAATPAALPPAAATAAVDGYTVTVAGAPKAGALKLTVSRDGRPVTDLQPYLESFGHLTAFHAGDQAFAHLHPEGGAATGEGGPDLRFHAELPGGGDWRLFLQFQTGGTLHTAALTLPAMPAS
ncbi:hypothetical protein AB0K43_06365 [Kitasatospora sp. NPDC049258]|uniref:hypothetical protein n=1 Tax=Kitasatospora sp. NPDC049258 TaxID=3155394 RepID=UPI00342E837B